MTEYVRCAGSQGALFLSLKTAIDVGCWKCIVLFVVHDGFLYVMIYTVKNALQIGYQHEMLIDCRSETLLQ